MGVTTPQEQVEKYLVKNNTAGQVGVVVLSHDNKPEGTNIEPFGALWMSEQEIILTARAPKRPEDNPFEEQTLIGVNPETQARQEFKVRPLTLEHDGSRYVPTNDRYVPTQAAPQEAAPAPTQTAAVPPEPIAAPPSTGSSAGQAAPPPPVPAVVQQPSPAPRQGPDPAPVALSGQEREDGPERESWVAQPEAPGRVIPGSLSGDGTVADAEVAPQPTDAPSAAERFVPSVVAQAAPQTVGSQPQEEHAQAVDPQIGEETGAAKPPAQDAPEGEYAQAEEVGSPHAPQRDNNATPTGG